jgi:hypothetical protein
MQGTIGDVKRKNALPLLPVLGSAPAKHWQIACTLVLHRPNTGRSPVRWFCTGQTLVDRLYAGSAPAKHWQIACT